MSTEAQTQPQSDAPADVTPAPSQDETSAAALETDTAAETDANQDSGTVAQDDMVAEGVMPTVPMQNVRTILQSFFNLQEGRASDNEIRQRILAGSKIDGIHTCLLIVAMFIASIGLNVNSTEAIIGAMLICPLMGSVLALAYSIASADTALLKSTLVGLVGQVVVCLATSTLYFVVSPLSTQTSEIVANSQATIWDVFIALAGGFAGAIGYSRHEEPSTLIAGVAVATALMPPLCATGFGLAARDLVMAASAFYEFLVNVIFITIAAEVVLIMLRTPLYKDLNGDGIVTLEEMALAKARALRLRRIFVIVSVIAMLPSLLFTVRTIREAHSLDELIEHYDDYETETITLELGILYPDVCDYRIGPVSYYDSENDTVNTAVVATVTSTRELSAEEKRDIQNLIHLHVPGLETVTFVTS